MFTTRIAVALALLACTFASHAEEPGRLRQISVSGTATTHVAPDTVVWSVWTSDLNLELPAAKASSDVKLKKLLTLTQELGVAPEDVQTANMEITKSYDSQRDGQPPIFRGFLIRRSLSIKQHDISRFDEFLTKMVSSTDIEASFYFESSKLNKIRWDTRLEAVKIAKEKAVAMAEVLGATVGEVVSLDESSPILYGRGGSINQSNNFSNVSQLFSTQSDGGGGTADTTQGTLAPGALDIQVSISATFELK